jgi:hypothetical protein
MRNGESVSGVVTASSPTQVTLSADDNTTRIINMTDVKTIEYGDTPAQQTAQAPATGAPAPAAVPQQLAPNSAPAPAPVTSAPKATPAPAAQSRPAEPAPPAETRYHPDETVIKTKTYVLPVGAELSVRTGETIDSKKAAEGQTFAADIARDVLDANGDVVIPRGSNAQVIIRSASSGNRFVGKSDLVLDLESVSIGGRRYLLDTENIEQKGKSGIGANKRTATFTGGGAAIGAIIGAIAGQGKGAAIGAASGAAAGLAGQVITRGGSIRVPAESLLTFRLDKALRVKPLR